MASLLASNEPQYSPTKKKNTKQESQHKIYTFVFQAVIWRLLILCMNFLSRRHQSNWNKLSYCIRQQRSVLRMAIEF